MAFDEGPLARWSRRKAEDRAASASREEDTPSREEDTPPTPALDTSSVQEGAAEPAPDLDSASLEWPSDFSRFVCAGISDTVQRAALRRLWQSSALFSASDGLDVYRGNYANALPLQGATAAASRALEAVAVEQVTVEQPAAEQTVPAISSQLQRQVESGTQQEISSAPATQEPQHGD